MYLGGRALTATPYDLFQLEANRRRRGAPARKPTMATTIAGQRCPARVDVGGRRKPEDAEDYKAFEAAIISDSAPKLPYAGLLLRLASLLCGFVIFTVETDLIEIQAEALRKRRHGFLPTDQGSTPSPIALRKYPCS
jgi:hypothetical protein